MSRSTVLILGATGRLGSAAVLAFAAAGWRVLAQQRQTTPLPAGAERVSIALHDTAALVALATGARIVVYGVNPLYDRWDTELLPLARLGMNVAEGLGATLLLPGNIYNYGPDLPPLLRRDTPKPGGTAKGVLRCEMEAEFRDRVSRGCMSVAIVRAGDFYGHGRGGWFDQAIVKDILRGKLVYPGPLDVPHAWAYLPDLARAFVAVAERSVRGESPTFEELLFAGHTMTGRDLLIQIESAAEELGLQPANGWRVVGLPWGLIRLMGLFKPMMRELARMSYLWRVPHGIDGSSLVSAVGELPTTPSARALCLALANLQIGTRSRRSVSA